MGLIIIILIIILIIIEMQLIQILISKYKIVKWILPILSFILSINIVLGIIVFERHVSLDYYTYFYYILILIIFNIPTILLSVTNFIMNNKKDFSEKFAKKIKLMILINIIVLISLFIIIQMNVSKYITSVNKNELIKIENNIN